MADFTPSFAKTGPVVLLDPTQANPTPALPEGTGVLARRDTSVPSWDPGSERLNWIDSQGATASEWDRIVIAGQQLLAFASVEGDKDTRLQIDETPGSDGSSNRTLGVSPAPIVIRLRFLSLEALQEWAALVPFIQPVPGKPRPDAVDVYHPALAVNGIKALFLKTLGTPRTLTPGGPMEVVTRWIEFLPQKKSGAPKQYGSKNANLKKTKTAASLTPLDRTGPK